MATFTFAQDCGVTHTTTSNSITISGLDAPHYIVKVFNPNWSINFECVDDCDNPQTVNNLSEGTYHLRVNTYSSSWAPLCDFTEDIIIIGGGSGSGITIDYCSEDIVLPGLPGNESQPAYWDEPQASTTCPEGGLTITQTDGPQQGIPISNEVITIAYNITDACGNTTTCSFQITALTYDATIEFTYCPENITVQATSADGAIVSWDDLTATSNCDDEYISQSTGLASGSLFPIGTTDIVFVAGGIGGGYSCDVQTFCLFDVTVVESNNPCAVDYTSSNNSITVTGLNDAPHTIFKLFNPNWSINTQCFDNCADPLTIAGLTSGATYHLSYNLYDANWQPICSDVQDVVISGSGGGNGITLTSCPEDIDIEAPHSSNNYSVPITWNLPTATTDCAQGGLTITQIQGATSGANFSPISNGHTIVYEFTDACGNSEFCIFFIDVYPEGTIVNCPDDIVVNATSSTGTVVNYDNPSTISYCGQGAFDLNFGLTSGSVFPIGITDVSYTAFMSGSPAFCQTFESCFFTVTVNESGGGNQPDLDLSDLKAGNSGVAGTVFSFTVDIDNVGTAPATGSYVVGWYLSNNNSLSSDDLQVGVINTGNTPIGKQNDIPSAITIPNDFAPGNYYLIGKIDDSNNIQESNENNNIIRKAFMVTEGNNGGGIQLPCDLNYSLSNGTMTISGAGLNSGHVIVKLFSPSWSTVFSCNDDCGSSITIPNIGSGTYHLSVNLYNANWQPTCNFLEDIQTSGAPRLTNEITVDQFRSIVLNKLYPVPASNRINIEMSALGDAEIVANIYDARGTLINQKLIQLNSGENNISWDIDDLPSGFYQILFETGSAHAPIRFIKQDL